MFKKIILISIITISIISMQQYGGGPITIVQAQEKIGISDIVFHEEPIDTIHGFAIDQIGYIMIKLHLITAGKDIKNIYYQEDILKTIKRLEELTKTDVIQILDMAENKQEALSKYLNQCFHEIQKGEIISAYIRQEMEVIKADMNACLIDKDISDKTYFDAINRYDQSIMEAALADSIRHDICASEKRIQYNAKISITRKLVFYLGLLQKKYDVLFAKQDIIAKNFEIFRDNILPELNEIDQLLKQYTF